MQNTSENTSNTDATLILIGVPAWGRTVEGISREAGFALRVYGAAQREKYVSSLADDHAALIVVDGDATEDWQFWVTTPAVSPATRRIPIVFVGSTGQARQAALDAGAAFALAPDMVGTELPTLIRKHARTQSTAEREQLHSQCDEPLPERAREAIRQFNAGEYYRQHDLLEEQWMEEEGPVRDLYRAILQVGIAYYQVQRGNKRGAYKMILRCIQWLNVLPDTCQGVDVAQLRADAAALRDALNALPPDGDLGEIERTLLKPVTLIDAGTGG